MIIDDEFTIDTSRAKYICQFQKNDEKGFGEWKVKMTMKTERASGEFRLPSNWARTRVFQFVNSIDKNFE